MEIAVDFALACKKCAEQTFQVFGHPTADKTLFAPPHQLKCVSCGNTALLFNGRAQGYDGILNGGCSYERGSDEESPVPGQFKVVVGLLYNIELKELRDLAAGGEC